LIEALFWFGAGVAATLGVQWLLRNIRPSQDPIKYYDDGRS
jgi:hypothetical protein